MIKNFAFACLALGALSACGDTVAEQAAVGAVAGAGAAIVTDGDILTSAVLAAGGNVAYCQRFPDRCDDAGTPFE